VREWGDDIPPIHGSRAQLERAFHNLLTNAGRAMRGGGTLTLRTQREGRAWIIVEVKDTGVGIPLEAREKIFRIGFSDWGNGIKGSGLGLNVARKNVENHGGRIEVISAPGAGTTVAVHLPIQAEGAIPVPAPGQAPKQD
jgi:signal transduction histidine kinase